MKTLDRYIIKQFLANFVVLFVVVMSLFIVVDLLVEIDEFVQAGEVHKEFWYGIGALATAATIVDYYVPVVLLVYVFFNGLIVVGAMGFTIVGLQRNRELTAVIASGVSLYRIAGPVLVTGLLLSALTLPVQEFILPDLAPKLVRSKSQLKHPKQGLESKQVYYAQAGDGHLLSAAKFDADDGVLTRVRILQRDYEQQQSVTITAPRATWNPTHQRWDLEDGVAELLNLDPAVAEVRSQKRGVLSYETDLSPTVLLARRNALFASLLSIRSLEGLARNQAISAAQRSKVKQIISSRFSLMVLNALVLVMGLPFFLKRLPGNTMASSLKAAGLCIGAWGGGLLMLQLSPGNLPIGGPVLVAWLPVVIYLPVSAWLIGKIES